MVGLFGGEGGSGGASAVAELTDVVLTSLADGQILRYDGAEWVNVTPASVAISGSFADLSGKPTTLSGYGITDAVASALLGASNGVATLDSGGKLPVAQLTDVVVGAVVYHGVWNATTNTPALTSGAGTKGNYYKVSVSGTHTVDGISQWNAGDVIIYNGTTWDKIDGVTSEVLSVAGQTGTVTLAYTDISGLATVAHTGAYADLSGKPSLATVATTGAYADLSGTPSLAAVATTGAYADLSGKPSLATVATTGAYSDLSGKPTVPSTVAALTGDVLISAPSNNQVLTYNSGTGKWANVTPTATLTLTGDVTGSGTGSIATTLAQVTATGGSAGRTFAARAGDRLTPYDFGAVGDGSTDDTAAVAAWWTYITANGVAGYVPKGTYKLVGQVTWDIPSGARTKGVKIEGAGPQQALFDFTTTSSPALQIKCSSGATFYSTFREIGFRTNLSGTGVRIGLADFSDPFNSCSFENLVISNTSSNAAAIAIETNYMCDSHFNVVANCGANTAAAAFKANHSVFCNFKGAYDTAAIGLNFAGDYSYGNVIVNVDYEVVGTCVQFDSANATKNTFLGGTFVYSGSAAITGNAGSSNLFINPNISGSGSNATGSGIVILGGDGTFSGVGGTMFSMGNVASAVNNAKVFPAATGNAPAFAVIGSDTNIAAEWRSKGTGRQFFTTGGGTQFELLDTASAVNYIRVTGATTGNRPVSSAQGSDSNVGMTFQSKGTSPFIWKTQAGSSNAFGVLDNGAAVSTNYIEVLPAATGTGPTLRVSTNSTDSNADLNLAGRGTGTVKTGGLQVLTALLTTKGDLYTRSTVDARLGVGTDGKVLAADSSQTTGLAWVVPGTNSPVTVTATTGTTTVTPGPSALATVTLQATTTLTIAAGTDGQALRLRLVQDATGSRLVSFDSSVEFGSDISGFTATTTANKTDIVGLIYSSAASKWMLIASSRGYS